MNIAIFYYKKFIQFNDGHIHNLEPTLGGCLVLAQPCWVAANGNQSEMFQITNIHFNSDL